MLLDTECLESIYLFVWIFFVYSGKWRNTGTLKGIKTQSFSAYYKMRVLVVFTVLLFWVIVLFCRLRGGYIRTVWGISDAFSTRKLARTDIVLCQARNRRNSRGVEALSAGTRSSAPYFVREAALAMLEIKRPMKAGMSRATLPRFSRIPQDAVHHRFSGVSRWKAEKIDAVIYGRKLHRSKW